MTFSTVRPLQTCAACTNQQIKLTANGPQPQVAEFHSLQVSNGGLATLTYQLTNCSDQTIFLSSLLILSYPYTFVIKPAEQSVSPGQSFSFAVSQSLTAPTSVFTNTVVVLEANPDGGYTQISCSLSSKGNFNTQ